jgi:hypothetical protein
LDLNTPCGVTGDINATAAKQPAPPVLRDRPSHRNKENRNFSLETIMIPEISSKLAAFAVALMMNGLIIAGVAYMFNVQVDHQTTRIADSGHRQQCRCTPHSGDCRCGATVKVHIKHIMDKLGAKDRTQAVAIGIRRGVIHI